MSRLHVDCNRVVRRLYTGETYAYTEAASHSGAETLMFGNR